MIVLAQLCLLYCDQQTTAVLLVGRATPLLVLESGDQMTVCVWVPFKAICKYTIATETEQDATKRSVGIAKSRWPLSWLLILPFHGDFETDV